MPVNVYSSGHNHPNKPRFDHEHPDYRKNLVLWEKCRDCFEGEEAVKDAGYKYLPYLSLQESEDYRSYQQRALFLNVMRRTINGLVGSAVRKKPIIDVPSKMDSYLRDIDMRGTNIYEFIQNVLMEMLITGRVSLVADRDGDSRVYLTTYNAESLINWRVYNSFPKMCVFTEILDDSNDGYDHEEKTQYRIFDHDENGNVVVRLAQEFLTDDSSEFELTEEVYPTLRGERMSIMPVITINSGGLGLNIKEPPPLLDLANLSLSHYRSSADLEHGRHYTALPQPWITGVDIDEYRQGLRVGADTAWIIPAPDARVGYLEFSGQGLQSLENALTEKEQMMAVAGARLLESKKGVESAEAARIRQNIETSVLSGIVLRIQNGVEAALRYCAMWEGLNPDDVKVELNMDFVDVRIPHQEIIALVQSYQMGGISMDTLLHNLKQGEVIPHDVSIEEEREKIELDHGSIREPIRDRSEALQDGEGQKAIKETSLSGRGD